MVSSILVSTTGIQNIYLFVSSHYSRCNKDIARAGASTSSTEDFSAPGGGGQAGHNMSSGPSTSVGLYLAVWALYMVVK